MADAHTIDPPFVGKFVFKIGTLEIGAFTEVSGLAVSVDVEELAEGGQNAYTHKLLGRMRWPNIVLKRGLTDSNALFTWLLRFSGEGFNDAKNKVTPETGSISVLTPAGDPFRTWSLIDVKPVKWSGPRLAASSRDLAIEELEVCHSGFTVGK
ncbi:phage tail protein [Paractinoplanes globisporus]|uniref:Phage tail protein n=1 Tax=Paractinoplanes globisporus TaxID=113565 RepID=A0ABW6W4M1_9ACTN|nr:phage tail protein [Actinoplanes globisporus]